MLAVGSKFVRSLTDALGLKHVRVVELRVRMAVDEVVTVTAEFYPEREALETVHQQFKLTATPIPSLDQV